VTNLPIGLKFWPEMVGSLLLWVLLSMVISSQFRQKWGLNYKRWKAIHKLLGYLVIIFLAVHVLFVSDSFEHVVPRAAFLTIFVAVVVLVILSKKGTGQSQ
jgi:predicted ferric reductase